MQRPRLVLHKRLDSRDFAAHEPHHVGIIALVDEEHHDDAHRDQCHEHGQEEYRVHPGFVIVLLEIAALFPSQAAEADPEIRQQADDARRQYVLQYADSRTGQYHHLLRRNMVEEMDV